MLSARGSILYHGFTQVAAETCDIFRPWTYDAPMVFSAETNQRMHRVQQSFMKCVRHFVEQYDEYRDLMPVSDHVYDILTRCRRKPYRPGTYRTDFVIDINNRFKLIETTCRFALNGFFTSGIVNLLAGRFLAAHPHLALIDDYTPFYDHLMDYFGDFTHVCLLKGSDERNETKFLVPIFEKAGFPVKIIPADDVSKNLDLFDHAAVIGELDHIELCRQPLATIDAIIDANALNDLRTVFLIHDKRFYALLSHEPFLQAALSAAELEEFRPYLISTYTRHMQPDIVESARTEKERWIIKPNVLGKSIDVFAGCVTDQGVWDSLFTDDRLDTMVVQEFIPQRKFTGSIGAQHYNDYAVGTLLFFEDRYFGPGIVRASSHPVTNKVDDRKIAPIVTAESSSLSEAIVL